MAKCHSLHANQLSYFKAQILTIIQLLIICFNLASALKLNPYYFFLKYYTTKK